MLKSYTARYEKSGREQRRKHHMCFQSHSSYLEDSFIKTILSEISSLSRQSGQSWQKDLIEMIPPVAESYYNHVCVCVYVFECECVCMRSCNSRKTSFSSAIKTRSEFSILNQV